MLPKSHGFVVFACVIFTACLFVPAPAASAQQRAIKIEELKLPASIMQQLRDQLAAPKGSQGIAFGSPVAFGAQWGELYAGIGGETLTEEISTEGQEVDGSVAIGFGVGNARRSIGLDTTIGLISLTEGLAKDGNVSFKLHASLPKQSAFAVGLENTGRWGDAKVNSNSSVYAVYSKFWAPTLFGQIRPVATSLGVGTERFVDVNEAANKDGIGVFGSAAILINTRMSTILDWTGVDLNAGLSFLTSRRVPITLTFGLINLTENRDRDVEFSAGIGYSYSFSRTQ